MLHRIAFEGGTVLVVPPAELCTDNGAMIAWAGAERLALGLTDTLDTPPHARWPLAAIEAARPGAGAHAGRAPDRAHELSTTSPWSEPAPGAARSRTSSRAPAAP